MQQFIPFEDDWAALENLRPEDLVPYRVGLLDRGAPTGQRSGPASSSVFSSWPAQRPVDDPRH